MFRWWKHHDMKIDDGFHVMMFSPSFHHMSKTRSGWNNLQQTLVHECRWSLFWMTMKKKRRRRIFSLDRHHKNPSTHFFEVKRRRRNKRPRRDSIHGRVTGSIYSLFLLFESMRRTICLFFCSFWTMIIDEWLIGFEHVVDSSSLSMKKRIWSIQQHF